MLRTHKCGDLNLEQKEQTVSLCGWVDRHRDMGQLFFVSLRDRYGVTQCVFEGESSGELVEKLKGLHLEDCIQVNGRVRERTDKDKNKEMATGDIEVVIDSLNILNRSEVLPFQVKDDVSVSDELRLKYRYLDLRRPKMQRNIELRHQVIQSTRSALCELGFMEIETPLLIRSTPEGARDFVVPSRLHPGKFYALPQSPQLYKQMLMISGCDRYFQFAPAFRDEDLRADRVPVHTQIDMEMTFVEEKDVFAAVEAYMKRIFNDVMGRDLPTPFPIMSYKDAMERYGIDKPDTRFAMELQTVSEWAKSTSFKVFQEAAAVRCIVVENSDSLSRKDIDQLTELAKVHKAKGLAWTRLKGGEPTGGIGKFIQPDFDALKTLLNLKENDLVLFVADRYEVCCAALAHVRLEMGKRFDLIDRSQFNFLWVNEFPLFEYNEEREAFDAMHHLFTMPMQDDMEFLDSEPGKVRGQLYDLVLNGWELVSGSIRINRHDIQQKVLDIVKMPKQEAESKFGFLMNSFKYGAPPHGGSAMGLDRICALLAGTDSIRDVIAYPCNNKGEFPLDGSPADVYPEQMKELFLQHTDLPKSDK